ncbi:MAG: hypothetical protein ACD_18C00261G0004 [uncultured bacterium]|nr:MAG: hypothetical protein ACD_18C00261G0004 [uncultured bacterium]OGH83532.1 MAG: hypothetical protein A2488_01020 [Candidatus Magasanikbacteria bacterium RIFOXYC12_FULL_32_21b]OGH89150.1 MAG: hypothetical protein A2507_00680 [Candidatus Magasanikbacteria bacterium RIFOXYD12_FULL_33_17]HAO52810.1 hypothetical protein [Candidatus Magasanikbacteria bacterium]
MKIKKSFFNIFIILSVVIFVFIGYEMIRVKNSDHNVFQKCRYKFFYEHWQCISEEFKEKNHCNIIQNKNFCSINPGCSWLSCSAYGYSVCDKKGTPIPC